MDTNASGLKSELISLFHSSSVSAHIHKNAIKSHIGVEAQVPCNYETPWIWLIVTERAQCLSNNFLLNHEMR